MKIFASAVGAAAFAAGLFATATALDAKPLSDAAIRQKIIRASIDEYPGSCPCPYNSDRAGRSCGRRSAWSREGGYSPKCYSSDVSAAEVKAYRARR
ncbi:MAG TPA: hypothetical protein VF727_03030 [Allosphingosinicella sp.]|jgi:hypothetical protein